MTLSYEVMLNKFAVRRLLILFGFNTLNLINHGVTRCFTEQNTL